MIVLDAKTGYSFTQGFGSPERWVQRAKELGMKGLGIADYCSTWGFVPFAKTGFPIAYGVQLPAVILLEKDPRHDLVTIIAKNDDGIKEIYKAVSIAYQQSYYRPRITYAQLSELNDCFVVSNRIQDNRVIERFNLETVFMYGPRFPYPQDREAFSIISNLGHENVPDNALHLMSGQDAQSRFGVDTSLTEKIFARCQAGLKKSTLIQVSKEKTLEDMIDYKRVSNSDRLNYEIAVIREKGFEDYIKFVADIVQWAKKRMLVGPGRGSSGGSLLCYALNITEVDPEKHGTLFERFIDISRSDLPDIDVDFPDIRRQEVLDYIKSTYGDSHVARLGTISFLGGKSAFNDVARVAKLPFDAARQLGKYTEGVVQGQVHSPKWVMENVPEVAEILEKFPDFRLAAQIDGSPRHHGVHAAGVIVTNEPIQDFGSINKDGVICLDLEDAEYLNLLKMDALGLRTLSILQDCCDAINMDAADLWRLPLDDKEVYSLFNSDKVTGVFQFEGHAVRQLTRSVYIDHFSDLCALTSLARPGPLMGGAAGAWADRRSGKADYSPEEHLGEILQETFGTIIYQEQAMAIVKSLAGFTIVEANGFRRAVGKKDPEKLATYREKFVERAAEKLGQYRAETLWDEMENFGSYAFNKSHAVAYSMISYAAAYMKLHYPLEFALAHLKHSQDEDQAKALLRELVDEGIKFVPFDPNKSEATWSIQDGVIYGGFDSVKGIGIKTAKELVQIRKDHKENWFDHLTNSQVKKLTSINNTPWHGIRHFQESYAELYNSPETWIKSYSPKGISGPVFLIKNIPTQRGSYVFLGKIIRKMPKEKDGSPYINIIVADDTGEVGMTISRKSYREFQWINNKNSDGQDFIFRANVISDGQKWLFVEKIIEIKES